MSIELTPEQKFAAEDPEIMVPRALRKGRDPEAIIAELVALDWSTPAARALVARVADDLRRYQESPEGRASLIREARRQFLGGLTLVAVGIGFTGFTLLMALAGATTYIVISTGLILVGLITANVGRRRWRFYSKPMVD